MFFHRYNMIDDGNKSEIISKIDSTKFTLIFLINPTTKVGSSLHDPNFYTPIVEYGDRNKADLLYINPEQLVNYPVFVKGLYEIIDEMSDGLPVDPAILIVMPEMKQIEILTGIDEDDPRILRRSLYSLMEVFGSDFPHLQLSLWKKRNQISSIAIAHASKIEKLINFIEKWLGPWLIG